MNETANKQLMRTEIPNEWLPFISQLVPGFAFSFIVLVAVSFIVFLLSHSLFSLLFHSLLLLLSHSLFFAVSSGPWAQGPLGPVGHSIVATHWGFAFSVIAPFRSHSLFLLLSHSLFCLTSHSLFCLLSHRFSCISKSLY